VNTDQTLVLAWLLLAHLVGDFLLQHEAMVADKFTSGRRRWRGLAGHGAGVGLALTPVPLVYGARGAAFLVVVTVGHVLIDRWKVRATRHAEAVALAEVHRRHQPADPGETGLGPAWTPIPGALFLVDQLAHIVLTIAAWMVLLVPAPPTAEYLRLADLALAGMDLATVHGATLLVVVLAVVLLVNVRAAALFVGTLVNPREGAGPRSHDAAPTATTVPRPVAWRVRLGPLVATAEPRTSEAAVSSPKDPGPQSHASPARIGATIGILERLLIVFFVVTGATAAIGFVVAAKTLARFKQLDDRDFAEYYLLGTLASVSVALVTGWLASLAFATLP
jgi:hypothetical protein